jgi:tetratricopeptide (TPR) repeat protein
MQSYVCVLRAYVYRRNFSREQFDPILRCLEDAVRRDPNYSNAWAMLALLHVDAGRIGYAGHRNTQDEYANALQAASQAVKLEPNNTLALKALAAVNYYMGRYDDSERVLRHALDLNPYDPETLAQLGWRLAARGKFDEGIPILKRAIERTVNPPGWYFHFIAIDLYLKGNYEQMFRVAERSAADGSHFSQVLIAIAAAELGKHSKAQNALEKISAYKPLAGDPAAFMRRHGATDQIVDGLMAGLQKAHRIASSGPRKTLFR